MRPWWQLCRFFAQWAFILAFGGRTFGVRQVPARGPALLLCNHQSFLDPVLVTLGLHRESAFMARDSLFRIRVFAWLIRSLNAFAVTPGQTDVAAFRRSMRLLQSGGCLTAFPEGTRTEDGRVTRPQPGLLAIAQRCSAPIIPVVIEGAYEAWPRTAKLPRPRRIVVEYGRPMPGQKIKQVSSEQLQEELLSCWRQLQVRARGRLRRNSLRYDSVAAHAAPPEPRKP